MKRRVGIMGGTFDPIHMGHLVLGENAYGQFDLDEVLFMPSGNPPHKQDRDGRATLQQRIDMVQLAISDNPHFTLSLAEAHDEGYTYTKVTLERLKAENPDTEYYFIMGADSLFSFEQWREPRRIAELAVLVAAVRDHVDDKAMEEQCRHLRETLHADIRILNTPNMDISSHMLRDWISRGWSTRYYIPDNVIAYIDTHDLYRSCHQE